MCRCCQFLRWPPQHSVCVLVVRRFSGTVARKHGFHSVGFWLQRLGWIKSVRCGVQTGDLVVGSESAFSMDKLHHKDTVLVWNVSRRDFLCYSEAGPVLVLFLCLRVDSLSPLFFCLSTAPQASCLCALVIVLCLLWLDSISLCHVTAVLCLVLSSFVTSCW